MSTEEQKLLARRANVAREKLAAARAEAEKAWEEAMAAREKVRKAEVLADAADWAVVAAWKEGREEAAKALEEAMAAEDQEPEPGGLGQ